MGSEKVPTGENLSPTSLVLRNISRSYHTFNINIQVMSYRQYQHPGHIIPSISTSRSYHTFDVNIQVISYLQYQHPGHIITLMYGLCNYQRTTYSLGTIWSIQIHFDISWSLLLWTYILNTGWKMENTAAKLATPKGRDFRVLLHWLFSVSFKI